jgi:uncharacterized protein (TIRG00374 family)
MLKIKVKWAKQILFVLIGFGAFGAFIYYSNYESLEQLSKIQLWPTLGALLSSFGITCCIAIRWGILSNEISGVKLTSWTIYYHYFIISRALGFVLPKDLTDIGLRTASLKKRHGKRLSHAGASVILDRLFDVIFMLVFLIAVLPFWFNWGNDKTSFALMILFPLIIGIVLLSKRKLFFQIIEFIFHLVLKPFTRFSFFKKRVPNGFSLDGISKTALYKIFLLSFFKFVFTVARLVFFVYALGLSISPTIIALGTPLGQLSYLFAFTPGGLGIFEAGWLGILKLAGTGTTEALNFVVGQRILTIVLILTLAFVSQIVYLFNPNTKKIS